MTKVNPAQVQRYLNGVDYPCSKTDLVTHARDEGADETVITTLNSLQMDSFESPSQISEALGNIQ